MVAIPDNRGADRGPLTLPVRRDPGPDAHAFRARRWIDARADVFGGCREVGPTHVAPLREVLH